MTKEDTIIIREEEDYYQKRKYELARSDGEASCRYEKYRNCDPFPRIGAALLNSADIFDYVVKTGMIYPFNVDALAGATYEVALRGIVIWWDEESKTQKEKKLEKQDDSFELKPNSIAFVTLEPMFRIPDYMALRFNLKIVHVYKGLLLGTGPIVDPGFVGRLSIPLHNLTANTYTFHAGDGMIQMEFTKLSTNDAWTRREKESTGLYKRKRIQPGRTLNNYIQRALKGGSDKIVKCAIPAEIAQIKEQSAASQNEMKTFIDKAEKQLVQHETKIKNDVDTQIARIDHERKIARGVDIITLITVIALLVAVVEYSFDTLHTIKSDYQQKQEEFSEIETEYQQSIQEYEDNQTELAEKIDELESQLEQLQNGNAEGNSNE